MKKSRRKPVRKFKESDARTAEKFCTITAVLTIALCFLFVSGILQNSWVLNFIFIIGILMNLSVILVAVVRRKTLLGIGCFLLVIAEIVAVIYFAVTA